MTEDMQVAAQEMAMHISLCVCAEYIQSWGVQEFIQRVMEYSSDPDLEAMMDFLEAHDE